MRLKRTGRARKLTSVNVIFPNKCGASEAESDVLHNLFNSFPRPYAH